MSSIIETVREDNIDKVRELIRYKDEVGIYGHTALIYAVIDGHLEMVKLLINSGVDINIINNCGDTALMLAAYNGHLEIVKVLINNGVDMNIINKYGNTTLMWAACRGTLNIVKILLNHDADVNIINKGGHTALMYAVNDKHFKIVKVLKEHIKNEKIKIEYERKLENDKYNFIENLCGLHFELYLKIDISF